MEKGAPRSDWALAIGQGSATEAWPRKEVKEFWESISIDPDPNDSTKVVLHGPAPALRAGSGRIEDACGESPAASLLRLRSLVAVRIIRSLFVHHSCIIRSYSCIMQRNPSLWEY